MHSSLTSKRIVLSRRAFLRASGVTVALPLLDAMRPARAAESAVPPRRMVAIQTNMGILPEYFFPEKAGADYTASPYLSNAWPRIASR